MSAGPVPGRRIVPKPGFADEPAGRHRDGGAAFGWRRLVFRVAIALSCGIAASGAAAQQFVTDDAAIVDAGACQLEAWHGETASWILPACRLIADLEVTAGVGFVEDGGGHSTEYLLQAKYLLRGSAPDTWGMGVVAGIGYDPLAQVTGGVEGAFAYVPASVPIGDRLLLHANLGWLYDRAGHEHDGEVHDESRHALTWAGRADLLLPLADDRLSLIAELFGEDRHAPEYQLGLRSELIADRLLADVSWGGHTRGGPGAGWAVGLAWTPPPFIRTRSFPTRDSGGNTAPD